MQSVLARIQTALKSLISKLSRLPIYQAILLKFALKQWVA
ncbi:hypothetical protein LF25067_01789 [Limosilactobacillus fermentum]|nr:hypothetical protein LF25067_01789 [Limosilactobacillus fermentum]